MSKTIFFSKNDESSLFDGADAAALAMVDVPASIAKFEEILTARIQETYPDAAVRADDNRSNGYWAEGFGDLDDDIEAAAQAQRLAEDLFNDGNLWMVEAAAADMDYPTDAPERDGALVV